MTITFTHRVEAWDTDDNDASFEIEVDAEFLAGELGSYAMEEPRRKLTEAEYKSIEDHAWREYESENAERKINNDITDYERRLDAMESRD
jgi:hypothetical protein